jgi:hypothetical protein
MTVHRYHLIAVGLLVALYVSAAGTLSAAVPAGQPVKPFTPAIVSGGSELNTFQGRLREFSSLADELQTQARVTPADLDNLRRRADALKLLLPAAQRQISSAVSKLRAEGLWTADFDKFVLERAQPSGDADLLSSMREAGGPRAFLEQAPFVFAQVTNEVNEELRELAPKAAWQRLLEPLIGQPVHAGMKKYIRKAIQIVKTACYMFVPGCA